MSETHKNGTRPGVKPTQYRFEPPILVKLDALVELITAENGTQENRTSVLRRLIVAEHRRRISPPISVGESSA